MTNNNELEQIEALIVQMLGQFRYYEAHHNETGKHDKARTNNHFAGKAVSALDLVEQIKTSQNDGGEALIAREHVKEVNTRTKHVKKSGKPRHDK